jgi:hypothetical protein
MCFRGFPDVDGQKEQFFAGKIMTDLVDEVGFVGAVAAPSGPELQQNYFPFDGVVSEFFAARGGGIESGAGSLSLGSATRPRAARSKAHASAPGRRMDRVGMGECNTTWVRSCQFALLVPFAEPRGELGRTQTARKQSIRQWASLRVADHSSRIIGSTAQQ